MTRHMVVFECVAGSNLYGVSRPDSDIDMKGIFLPSKRDILLGNCKDVVKNVSSVEKDTEYFVLYKYLHLASRMQTIPVEMLFVEEYHVPDTKFSWVWEEIRNNRNRILNRNPKAFSGYCKSQAVRYSMRGKRLETYEAVCEVLDTDGRVLDVLDMLLVMDDVKVVKKPQPDGNVLDFLDVYGRQCSVNMRCSEARSIFLKPVMESGRRARNACLSGGQDNKALYHALRIADEGIQLFSEGKITFPSRIRDTLAKIREGMFDMDEILDMLDEKLDELEHAARNSNLREKPDMEYVENLVAEIHEMIVCL